MNKEENELLRSLDIIYNTISPNVVSEEEVDKAGAHYYILQKYIKATDKSVDALSLIKRKPYECADAIHYVTINKIYPRMLNYKNYCMSIKNKLNEDEFNLITEVFLNVRGVK